MHHKEKFYEPEKSYYYERLGYQSVGMQNFPLPLLFVQKCRIMGIHSHPWYVNYGMVTIPASWTEFLMSLTVFLPFSGSQSLHNDALWLIYILDLPLRIQQDMTYQVQGRHKIYFLAGPTPSLSFCLCQIPEKNPKNWWHKIISQIRPWARMSPSSYWDYITKAW